jgi:choline dehydrogenase-like flavoprotein
MLEVGPDRSTGSRFLLGPSPKHGSHKGSSEAWASGLGGTSQLWGGQLWPWQPWEFCGGTSSQVHPWPLNFIDLEGHYARVLKTLGLPAAHSAIHSMTGPAAKLNADMDCDFSLRYSSWIERGKRSFIQNPLVREKLKDVTLIQEAAVNRITVTGDSRVRVEFLSGTQEICELFATKVVLAAGTLGNTRVLSNSDISQDLPALGKGFMDHVSKRVAEFDVFDWDKFRSVAAPKRVKGVLASPRIVPDVEFLRRHNVVPAYAHWEFSPPPGSAISSIRSYLRAGQTGVEKPALTRLVQDVGRDAGSLVEAVARAARFRERPVTRDSRAYLRIDVQQPARQDVNLTWTPNGESADLPNLSVQWRTGDEERVAASIMVEALLPALSRLDIGAVGHKLRADAPFEDIYHMMGGTRMADSSAEGVVDKDLRVFGTSNVFVAGASVFPSGGMANPTYTALALTDRLGGQLAR